MAVKSNCALCGVETRRLDGLCPNCILLERYPNTFCLPQQPTEQDDIKLLFNQKCADCGDTRIQVLKIYWTRPSPKGIPCPKQPGQAITFSFRCKEKPSEHTVRCANCQSKFNASPGRPRVYKTDEERLEGRRESQKIYQVILKAKALRRLGDACIRCDAPADVIRYNGEPGVGPNLKKFKRNYSWIYRRILEDGEFASQYLPFCSTCTAAHTPLGPNSPQPLTPAANLP